jgi:hypothetical protein
MWLNSMSFVLLILVALGLGFDTYSHVKKNSSDSSHIESGEKSDKRNSELEAGKSTLNQPKEQNEIDESMTSKTI